MVENTFNGYHAGPERFENISSSYRSIYKKLENLCNTLDESDDYDNVRKIEGVALLLQATFDQLTQSLSQESLYKESQKRFIYPLGIVEEILKGVERKHPFLDTQCTQIRLNIKSFNAAFKELPSKPVDEDANFDIDLYDDDAIQPSKRERPEQIFLLPEVETMQDDIVGKELATLRKEAAELKALLDSPAPAKNQVRDALEKIVPLHDSAEQFVKNMNNENTRSTHFANLRERLYGPEFDPYPRQREYLMTQHRQEFDALAAQILQKSQDAIDRAVQFLIPPEEEE